ncbi:Zinc finger (C3HC4-type RING finger) family protein [Abeliophyllum distichum]|uniref:Zinc finger (C3HC4-type RING finger) family protein n=1 Tax=Abeliophyllum distichum TaxID=126358 RepID=A0ABD1ULJ0_9LAMI
MSSSTNNKMCGICSKNDATGQGQAIFTAECSHTFHFSCVGDSVLNGNYICPICHVKWNYLPFTMPNFNANVPPPQSSSPVSHGFGLQTHPPSAFGFQALPRPAFGRIVEPWPELGPESVVFSDDEPLPTITADPNSSDSRNGLQNVNIKSIPEHPILAASESISQFAVLVGVRAPSLSENARLLDRAPIDLVAVLDVSGSMGGSKLRLLKRAVHFVIDNLGPPDRLSIVCFSSDAQRIFPLRRMTDNGREDAKSAVDSLAAIGSTNIVEGLKKGVQVLEERRQQNPVASIIFLSDGQDTCFHGSLFLTSPQPRQAPDYLHLLPCSICPRNRGTQDQVQQQTFPVHAFGFGSDHDPIAMHAISDESGGTFSFIESYEMIQDAFASCIGGLLSVVNQELQIIVRSASNGVEIKSISCGRYANQISDQGCQGIINVGDLYADEEKEFLINLSVPVLRGAEDEEGEGKTSLLDIVCSYRDIISKERVRVEGDLVEIRRPKVVSPSDMVVNLEVDRQRNRLWAAEGIAEAQRMAETGNYTGAQSLLSNRRTTLLTSASGQAGDDLCMWLESELKETEKRMGSQQLYERAGRAYALSGMNSHAYQRATTRGNVVPGAAAQAFSFGSASSTGFPASATANISFGAYTTPNMANMVNKSQQLNRTSVSTPSKE